MTSAPMPFDEPAATPSAETAPCGISNSEIPTAEPLALTGEVDSAVLAQMRNDWDERARENARHYIATGQEQWDDREFFRSGEINVANEVMPEMARVCQGTRSPYDLSMLEIGCGVGRMTRALARIFGHVTAVDVSPEMIEGARANLRDCPNVTLVLGDGATLPGVPSESQDFAFSFIVFQHIPGVEVITSYCREVFRVLRPGSLFRFQVLGIPRTEESPPINTWSGVSLSESDVAALASATGLILEGTQGAGTQYFWLTFRRPFEQPAPPPEAPASVEAAAPEAA